MGQMLPCPRCGPSSDAYRGVDAKLTRTQTLHGDAKLEIDHCARCDGILVARPMLEAAIGQRIALERWEERGSVTRSVASSLRCPLHSVPVVMDTYLVHYDMRTVEIDVCGECGGTWLDQGEPLHLRNAVDESVLSYRIAALSMRTSPVDDPTIHRGRHFDLLGVLLEALSWILVSLGTE